MAIATRSNLFHVLSEPIDRVLFWLGNVCREDFSEILLLAANGYGIGALKLFRGLYERVVTLDI